MVKAFLRKFTDKNNNNILNLRTIPDKDWIRKVREAAEYTPDAVNLERTRRQLLFVCEEMMTGWRDHEIIKPFAEYETAAFTRYNFSFYRRKENSIGIPFEAGSRGLLYTHPLEGGNRGIPPIEGIESAQKAYLSNIPGKTYATIKGEIYAVQSTFFSEILDKFKENGKLFIRKRIPTIVKGSQIWKIDGNPIRQSYAKQVICWMYVAHPDYWINHIDAGYAYSRVNLRTYEDFEDNQYITKRYYTYNEF